MSDDLKVIAENVGTRVQDESPDCYGMDPVTIAAIITTVLPGILKCFQREHEVPTVAAHDRIKRMHRKNPDRLKAKLSKAIAFGAQKHGKILTVDQTGAMADALIAEALESSEEVVYGLCAQSL